MGKYVHQFWEPFNDHFIGVDFIIIHEHVYVQNDRHKSKKAEDFYGTFSLFALRHLGFGLTS
jgi:hypothetical protein